MKSNNIRTAVNLHALLQAYVVETPELPAVRSSEPRYCHLGLTQSDDQSATLNDTSTNNYTGSLSLASLESPVGRTPASDPVSAPDRWVAAGPGRCRAFSDEPEAVRRPFVDVSCSMTVRRSFTFNVVEFKAPRDSLHPSISVCHSNFECQTI